MTAKPKPGVNKVTGKFLCTDCGCDVNIGKIIRHRIYCIKCAEITKGLRDENGMLVRRI